MINQLKSTLSNSRDTLLGDAVGMAALMVTLVAALFLPGMI